MGEKKRVEERKEGEHKREGRRMMRGIKGRKEIWERPGEDGGRRLHRTTSAQSGGEELATKSMGDLNKSFINTFIYLQLHVGRFTNYKHSPTFELFQGKLFTQINNEDLSKDQASLLDQFPLLCQPTGWCRSQLLTPPTPPAGPCARTWPCPWLATCSDFCWRVETCW